MERRTFPSPFKALTTAKTSSDMGPWNLEIWAWWIADASPQAMIDCELITPRPRGINWKFRTLVVLTYIEPNLTLL